MRKLLVLLVGVLLGAGACRVEKAVADHAPSDAGVAGDAIAIDAGGGGGGGGGGGAPPERKGPTCTKGCPCGNTCISCSKTCHVGSGTAKKRKGK